VFCEGKYIKVSKNCKDALQKLRYRDRERFLWVDAIAINQQDNEEKSHQVAFMGKIYKSADRALIWLGEASSLRDPYFNLPLSDLFFDYVQHMAAEIRDCKDTKKDPKTSPLYTNLLAQGAALVSRQESSPLIQGFLEVVRRPWWERVWVVQEAALVKTATIFCGGRQIEHSDISDFWSVIRNDMSHNSGLTYSLLDGFKHHMDAVTLVRERIDTIGHAKALAKVLDKCRRLQSTDRRDRVYAMLGMFGDFQKDLPQPNYQSRSQGLFAEMTVKFLTLLDGLQILGNATNVNTTDDLPSWAVDFARRPKFHCAVIDHVYQTSPRDSLPCFKVCKDFKELKIAGRHIDRIKTLPKAPLEGYHNPYIPLKALLGYQQSCKVGQMLESYHTGEDPVDVLWRTMCWDVDGEYSCPASSSLRRPFENFRNSLLSGKSAEEIEPELLSDEAHDFNDICVHSMPLCITEKGFLGSVPWSAEEGDDIVVFSGGELPFVIRRREGEGEGEDGEGYRFIGSCYVHGIMHGEAVPQSFGEDMEWFCLR